MKTISPKDKYWKVKYKLELLIQEQEWDSIYWSYLIDLKTRLEEKGFLYPSEYKKIYNWNLNIY